MTFCARFCAASNPRLSATGRNSPVTGASGTWAVLAVHEPQCLGNVLVEFPNAIHDEALVSPRLPLISSTHDVFPRGLGEAIDVAGAASESLTVGSLITADDLNDPHRRACSARRPAPHLPSDLERTDRIRDHCQPEPKLMFSQHGDHLVGSDAGLERGRDATSPDRSLDRVDRKDRGTESLTNSIRQLALPYRRQTAYHYQHGLMMPDTRTRPGCHANPATCTPK
jgi:hypothetical protein